MTRMPVFRESSRNARMELQIGNPEQLLKPGMFVRAQVGWPPGALFPG